LLALPFAGRDDGAVVAALSSRSREDRSSPRASGAAVALQTVLRQHGAVLGGEQLALWAIAFAWSAATGAGCAGGATAASASEGRTIIDATGDCAGTEHHRLGGPDEGRVGFFFLKTK